MRMEHDTSQVGSLFETTPSPEMHYTVYRVIEDSLCRFLYSPFVLEHCFARSVHVHNPPPGSGQAGKNRVPLSLPLPLRMLPPQVARSVRYKFPSCAVGATSAHHSLHRPVLSQNRSRGSRGALSHHTHTHTLLSPCTFAFPSGSRTLLGSEEQPRTHKLGLSILATPCISGVALFIRGSV